MFIVDGAEIHVLCAGNLQAHASTALSAANGNGSTQNNGHSVLRDVESQQVVEGIAHGMVLPFMQVTVTFHNVRYFVPAPEVSSVVFLLNRNFCERSGRLVHACILC